MNLFHNGYHLHHGNNDDDDKKALEGHEEKKKKEVMTSFDGSKTNAQYFQTQSMFTDCATILHDRENSDVNIGDTGDPVPIVELSSYQKARLTAPYKYSLFAKVLLRRVGYQLSTHLYRLWSPEGKMDIIPLEKDFFLVRFSLASDYKKVVEGVPWFIDDHYIILHPWVPDFKPSEAIISHAAVWVRFPELPIEYYDEEVLLQIGAAIGNVVKIDSVTQSRRKCKFARLCIQIDLNYPLPPLIMLGELCQRIKYEGLCYQCGRYGHLKLDCPYFPPIGNHTIHHPSSQAIPILPIPEETPNTSHSFTSHSSPSPYGPLNKVSPPRCQQLSRDKTDSREQQVQVSKYDAAIKSEPTQSGSGAVRHADEPNPPKETSEKTSVSISSPLLKMTSSPGNNSLEQNLLQLGEGTSTPADSINSSIKAKDMSLASTRLLKPKEASTGQLVTSVTPELQPGPFSSNLPLASSQQPHGHQTNNPTLSPTLSNSYVSTPSVGNDPQPRGPTQNQVESPSPPIALSTAPTSPLRLSYRSTDPVITKQFQTASTPLHLNQYQSPPTAIKFYSKGVQLSTKLLEMNSSPVELKELSTEGSPTVLSIDSKISNIDIGVNISGLSNGKANQHNIGLIPAVIDHTEYPVQKSSKKLLIWNCRGAGDAKFMHAIKDLCQLHQPSIVLLFETRISGTNAHRVIKDIGFSGSYVIDPVGLTGGMWLLWCKDDVQMAVNSTSSQHIHVAVQLLPTPEKWILYAVDAGIEPQNWRIYGVDSDSDPLSQPQSPEFYNSEQQTLPHTSQWVSSY